MYAYAAALHPELRLHRWTKAQWDAREARILAAAGDARVRNTSNDEAPAANTVPVVMPPPRPRYSRGTRSSGIS